MGFRVFSCPACQQTINTTLTQCPYCNASIDPRAAEAAADSMAKLNQACSDASFLRTIAWTTLVFFGLSLVPFLGMVRWGVIVLALFILPGMTIRWWVKFGTIKSDDPDYRRAKRDALLVTGGGALLFLYILLGVVALVSS